MARPLDSFNNFHKPFIARGDFMWGNTAVVLSPNVPRLHVGDEIKPIMPHRIVQWICRKLSLPINPVCHVRGAMIEEDQIFQSNGKLFMTPATWDRLERSAKQ